MQITNMFYKDINREINGVIKVGQTEEKVIKQEVEEYVITKELKKHFMQFFNTYADSFDTPTTNTAVWISGFFGSGKSHFLKMLSYILANPEVDGKQVVEYFREKFEEDPATFRQIDKSTQARTETILFNIDNEGPMDKDKTAVLKVFTKMFYKHLDYYGDNLKVAKFEKYIDDKGKKQEFREVFEEKAMEPWVEARETFDFCEDEVVETMVEVLGMSEEAARRWFDSSEEIEYSIAQLVSEIKEYVDAQSDDYRLIFMIDEVGQYIGTDTNLLLNLQSIVEEVGAKCGGKVWVMCTGQEAIDEIIKVRTDEFSRIQARFKTRLSLSSSSADEVIQKRILKKTDEATEYLEDIYEDKKNVMDNLFKFKNAVGDIRGFEGQTDYSENFPFVPYQFILMQKIFAEIRKHGHAGQHMSGAERSMLSGFQETAQKIQDKDENSLVPFWMFYDTVHSFLDSSIRRVIERCDVAAKRNKVVQAEDVNLLKLLYMIRYISDVEANLDNLIILMADDIEMDKIEARKNIQQSLDRLISQNYVSRTGEVYAFLTDEEQEIEQEIKNENVEATEVSRKIADVIFSKLYPTKKYRYSKHNDFEIDKKVDGIRIGIPKDNMELEFLTIATNNTDKQAMALMGRSQNSVVIVLEDTEYYNYLEKALKITNFAKKKNIAQLSKEIQEIIRNKQADAELFEKDSVSQLETAIKEAKFYVAGEEIKPPAGATVQAKVDAALSYLVSNVYSELDKIEEYAENDEDITKILNGEKNVLSAELMANAQAIRIVETYLEAQHVQHLRTTMAELQKRYAAKPYGWREIDIACILATLIKQQKVSLTYNGDTIRTEDPQIPTLLRSKTKVGNTVVQKRELISNQNRIAARDFLREYFDCMSVPEEDDKLTQYIAERFEKLLNHYQELLRNYEVANYPDKDILEEAVTVIEKLLRAKSDNIALVKQLLALEDDLLDMQEDAEAVEDFFTSQRLVFDKAVKLVKQLEQDNDYLKNSPAEEALNAIRLIVIINPKKANYNYMDIPKLNGLIDEVQKEHDILLAQKREELEAIIQQCMAITHSGDIDNSDIYAEMQKSDKFYEAKKAEMQEIKSITQLESFIPRFWQENDKTMKVIEAIQKSADEKRKQIENPQIEEKTEDSTEETPVKPIKKVTKKCYRQVLLPATTITTKAQIEQYVEKIKRELMETLNECDEIDIQ